MKISKTNSGLLILDNHKSHISFEVIEIAEQNGLIIVTFPPHCNHKLQSLGVCIFGPFKSFYSSFADQWMTANPGHALSIYNVASLAGQAFNKAFTPENINSGFKKTGIWPFNSHVFTEDMFLPASVTDTQSCSAIASSVGSTISTCDNHNQCSSTSVTDEEILNVVMPQPKTTQRAGKKRTQQMKSTIITDASEKHKRFPELIRNSESEVEVALESEEETVDSESSENNDRENVIISLQLAVNSL